MLVAIAGDIVGSVYERYGIKRTDFPLFGPGCHFADDTVLTIAVAISILDESPFREKLSIYTRYPEQSGIGDGGSD